MFFILLVLIVSLAYLAYSVSLSCSFCVPAIHALTAVRSVTCVNGMADVVAAWWQALHLCIVFVFNVVIMYCSVCIWLTMLGSSGEADETEKANNVALHNGVNCWIYCSWFVGTDDSDSFATQLKNEAALQLMLPVAIELSVIRCGCVLCFTAAIRWCSCSWYSWTSLHIIIGIAKGLYTTSIYSNILIVKCLLTSIMYNCKVLFIRAAVRSGIFNYINISHKHINLQTKLRLYEALILSTLLYSAELWPLTVTLSKKLEAVHHRWMRGILGITRRDKVTNEEIRKRTRQILLVNVIRERRLRWLGHVARMDEARIQKQALQWEVVGFKRRPGRPRTNWRDVVNKDLQRMGLTWEEVEASAQDRQTWRQRVALCIGDAGWTKSSQLNLQAHT